MKGSTEQKEVMIEYIKLKIERINK